MEQVNLERWSHWGTWTLYSTGECAIPFSLQLLLSMLLFFGHQCKGGDRKTGRDRYNVINWMGRSIFKYLSKGVFWCVS